MSASPSVTVVLTNYNTGNYVGSAIRSVRMQTYTDWQLIVLDDASTDDSLDRIRDAVIAESRACVEIMPRNSGGPGVPRNRGVEMARGRWVAFLDSDDLWHPRKLELQLKASEATGARFVATRRRSFRRDEEVDFAAIRGAARHEIRAHALTRPPGAGSPLRPVSWERDRCFCTTPFLQSAATRPSRITGPGCRSIAMRWRGVG